MQSDPARRRWWATVLVVAAGAVAPSVAHAWVETHVLRDDVVLDVQPRGSAVVEHRITLRVAGGPLPTFDLRGADPDAVFEPGAVVVPERAASRGSLEQAAAVALERVEPKSGTDDDSKPKTATVRLRFADKGLTRGTWVITARWKTSLSDRGLLRPEGARLQLNWPGLQHDDGFDSARLLVRVPRSPTPPEATHETDESAPAVLSSVRVTTAAQELELVRPYSPAKEAVLWRATLDALALGQSPSAPPPVVAARPAVHAAPLSRGSLFSSVAVAASCAWLVLHGALVAARTARTRRLAREAGGEARPLVPLPLALRALLVPLATLAGVALVLVAARPLAGVMAFALATLATVELAPAPSKRKLRAAGRWLVLSESEALALPRATAGSLVDGTTPLGALAAAGLFGLAAWGLAWLAQRAPQHAILLGFGTVVLVPLFFSGTRRSMPPDPPLDARRVLKAIARRLAPTLDKTGARLVARIHVPEGARDPDELRLSVVPKSRVNGLASLDIGVALASSSAGPVALPQVMVRLTEGSALERRLAERFAKACVERRGRSEGERVLSFSPRLPTARGAAQLAAALLVTIAQEVRPAPNQPAARAQPLARSRPRVPTPRPA